MKTLRMGISERVLDAMKQKERSKRWTARKVGMAVSTFHRKLKGDSDWGVEEVALVAEALEIPPAELFPTGFGKSA